MHAASSANEVGDVVTVVAVQVNDVQDVPVQDDAMPSSHEQPHPDEFFSRAFIIIAISACLVIAFGLFSGQWLWAIFLFVLFCVIAVAGQACGQHLGRGDGNFGGSGGDGCDGGGGGGD